MNASFYLEEDVVSVGKKLLGKFLFTQIGSEITGGMITETESYEGTTDRACHAFGGRRTKRNDAMYQEGGIAYVYQCYGLHYLLNVVTNKKNIPHAVLIRGIQPLFGIETMLKRRRKESLEKLTSGPGMVSQALGINLSHNKTSLTSALIWIIEGAEIDPSTIQIGPRIGVDYAKEDALLPYRFWIPSTPALPKT